MTRYTIHPDPDRPGFYVLWRWTSETYGERLQPKYDSVELCRTVLPENVRRVPDGERRDLGAVEEWVEVT